MKAGQNQMEREEIKQPRSLFKPASWSAKINFINHLILLNNVLITVIAEKAGGKSSFKTLLHNNLDKQIKPVTLSISPPYDAAQLIDILSSNLHLNRTSECDIASIVAQINERKAHVLLILDDAQNLPENLVKDIMWAIKSQGDFGFFHVCLISDYSIIASLNQLADSQLNNLIHTIELGPLSESEMRTYVLQRAMTAQLIHKPLAENQLKKFYRQTKGNIANINKQLESFILQSSKKQISLPAVNAKVLKSAGMGAVAIAALGLSYVYFDGFNGLRHFPHMENSTIPAAGEQNVLPDNPMKQAAIEFNPVSDAPVAIDTIAIEEKPLVSDIPSLLESSNVELVDTNVAINQQAKGIEEAFVQTSADNQPQDNHVATEEQAPQGQVAQEDPMPQEGPQEALAPQQEPTASQEIPAATTDAVSQEGAQPQNNNSTLNTGNNSAQNAIIESSKLSANQSYQEGLVDQKPAVAKKKVPVKADVAKAKPKTQPKAKAKTIAKAKDNPVLRGGYTIQLTASHNIKDIQRFKKSNKIFAKTKVRHFVNNQGHWYILTYGDYKNKDQAQAHASGLPPQFSKLKPWIRTLSGLNVVG